MIVEGKRGTTDVDMGTTLIWDVLMDVGVVDIGTTFVCDVLSGIDVDIGTRTNGVVLGGVGFN